MRSLFKRTSTPVSYKNGCKYIMMQCFQRRQCVLKYMQETRRRSWKSGLLDNQVTSSPVFFSAANLYRKFMVVPIHQCCVLNNRYYHKSTRLCRRAGPPTSGERAKFRTISFFVVASIMTIIGTLAYQLYALKVRFSSLLPANADLLPHPDRNDYIYIYDPLAGEAAMWKAQFFPWMIQGHDPSFRIARRLVQDAQSKDPERRRKAVALLAELELEDYHYDQLAHMLDFNAGVGLAHSKANHRFIARHGSATAKNPNMNLGLWFRELLSVLPPDKIHQCLLEYSRTALRDYHPTEQELDSFSHETLTGFESEHLTAFKSLTKKKISEKEFLKTCLQAVLSHSRVSETVPLLLQNQLMDVLMVVAEKYRHNQELMYLVVKIIANLSCDPNFHKYIRECGCVRLLAKFSESSDIKLYLPAKRALHNLDREHNTPTLPPGIYQLYPDFRMDEKDLEIDIIFVHGLLGGAFRTWRREDQSGVMRMSSNATSGYMELLKGSLKRFLPKSRQKSENEKSAQDPDDNCVSPICRNWLNGEWIINRSVGVAAENDDGEASQCWPRDWLPHDVPNARILAVDFDSFVTHWSKVCPVENTGRTLFERTTELMEKLASAGVGSRPVVWVTHSMGGLLVKQLLTRSAECSEQRIHSMAEQTRGAVFFSVPHIGSNVASKTSVGAARLLMPTLEVKELTYGSNELRKLNEKFQQLRLDKHYKVLSFGETKDVAVSSLGVKLTLVPLSSADPGYGDFYAINVNHLNVCKVKSRNAFVYRKVVELIQNVRGRSTNFDDGEFLPAPILFHATGNEKRRSKVFENAFKLFRERDKS